MEIVFIVSFYLEKLEILDISYRAPEYVQAEATHLEPLLQLSKLKVLKLKYLDSSDNNPDNVINLISKMTQLTRLELSFDLLKKQREVCLLPLIGKRLEHLKRFQLENYTLSYNSLSEFIKMAPQLDDLCLVNCELTLNESLIIKIFDIRKSQSNKNRTHFMPLTIKLHK